MKDFLTNVDQMFNDLLGKMDSGSGLVKCPYCKYDVYFQRNYLKYHLLLTHYFDGERKEYHSSGDKPPVTPLK